jgi:hemoglobin/transferrin/lactoferrin receptor protein
MFVRSSGPVILLILTLLLPSLIPAAVAEAQPFEQLASGRTLAGIVEDSSGGAISGARVAVSCETYEGHVVSGATGSFEIRNLPAERCVVVGSMDMFAPATVAIDLQNRSSAYVRLVLAVAGLETEIVVTPARGEQEHAFQVPEAVGITTREELESRPYQVLPQALREETGVLVQQTTTAQASPFIRGFSAQRIVYLVDGARLNTSAFRAGATQYLGWINPGLVQRIEVVRGPASVQYGSDAIGGTINVLSLRPSLSTAGTEVRGSVEGIFGSADLSGGLDASVVIQGERAAVRVGGSRREIGDLRTGRAHDSRAAVTRFLGLPSSVVDTRLPATGFAQGGMHAAATIGAGTAGTVNLLYLHEEQSGVSRFDRVLGGDGLHRSEFDPQRLDFALARYERGPVGPLHTLNASISLNRQQDDRLEQARPFSIIDRERGLVTAIGYQAQGSRLVAGRHSVTAGGEIYDEHIEAWRRLEDPATGQERPVRPEIPDGTRYTSSGLFAQTVSDLVPGRLSMRGGVRYGHFAFRTTSQPELAVDAERVNTSAVTFHAGSVLSVVRGLNVTFTVSRGFRAANAYDLGAIGISGGGFEVSPARAAALGAFAGTSDGADAVATSTAVGALAPEAVYAFEGGFKVRTGRVSASLTVFDLELTDTIQRRTAIFLDPVVGTTLAGYEIVRQDDQGRAYIAGDSRPLVTRVNVDRARVAGFETDAVVRFRPTWVLGGYFAMTNGRELPGGAFMRRMPPPFGGVRLKWEPADHSYWFEAVSTFALSQTRLSPGDEKDARIGARRTRRSIADFFNGTASDMGLVKDGLLVATGETLGEVQSRLLGGADASLLFTETPGFMVFGLRGGRRFGPRVDLTLILENVTDRNYRLHGSGVDAPGFNVQMKTRYRF